MRTLLRSVIWLYPASWRRRYARELSALLDDIEPGGRVLADLLLEALTMRIATFRLIPVACALTGVLIAVAITASGPDVYASAATLRLSEADGANPQSSVAPALRDVLNRANVRPTGPCRSNSASSRQDLQRSARIRRASPSTTSVRGTACTCERSS